ncbi:MAG: DUF4418 family protein [Lachnospiraceae bacterium]
MIDLVKMKIGNVKGICTLGTLYCIIGLLLALGPQFLFTTCEQTGETTVCFWTARAHLALGGVVFVAGIFYLLARDRGIHLGISSVLALQGAASLLLTYVLLGMCEEGMMLMHCRVLMLPALTVLGTLLLLIGLANALYLLRKK